MATKGVKASNRRTAVRKDSSDRIRSNGSNTKQSQPGYQKNSKIKSLDRVLRLEILDDGLDAEVPIDDCTQSAGDREKGLSEVRRVKTINVSSKMLAKSSPFFKKMFFNGMKESNELQVTLYIDAYEEDPLMYLLECIRSNTPPKGNPSELLQLLIVADKFELSSCMARCTESLNSLLMNYDLASLFLDLPKRVSEFGAFKSLTDSANKFFSEIGTFDVFPEDLRDVRPRVIKIVLSSDDLQIESEDVAYDFLMKWVTDRFQDVEKKRDFLHTRIRKLIRFPYLSYSKILEFENCSHFDKEFAREIKTEYLEFYKHKYRRVEFRRLGNFEHAKRDYVYFPAIIRESGRYKTRVFLELDRKDLQNLAESRRVKRSIMFKVDNQEFHLALVCNYWDKKPSRLGIRLHMNHVPMLTGFEFKVAYAEKTKPEYEFVATKQVWSVFNMRKSWVDLDYLLGTEWDAMMAPDSQFFIDGKLTLKATITILTKEKPSKRASSGVSSSGCFSGFPLLKCFK